MDPLAWYVEQFERDHELRMQRDPFAYGVQYEVWCKADDGNSRTIWQPGDPPYLCAGRAARAAALGP